MINFLENLKLSAAGVAVAAGSSIDANSTIIDMQGYDGCVFFTQITDSADTGVAALTIEQHTVNSGTGMAALAGAVATKTSAANDDLNGMVLAVDVRQPRERYLQAVRTSATANIAYGDVFAVRYKGRKAPMTYAATEGSFVTVAGPVEA